MATIAETLRQRRKDLKVSQEELALFANVSERTIRNFEKGETSTSLATVEAIANVLGCEINVKVRTP